jgi:hypothetical protein
MAKNITTQYHNSLIVNEITGKVEGGYSGSGSGSRHLAITLHLRLAEKKIFEARPKR